MSPDDTTRTNTAAAGAAPANPASGPVEGTDPRYPPYAVEFSGPSVPGGAPILVTGPHTFFLPPPPGGGQVTVSLTRLPSDGSKPNLSITFT
jgi:hypothetical protein